MLHLSSPQGRPRLPFDDLRELAAVLGPIYLTRNKIPPCQYAVIVREIWMPQLESIAAEDSMFRETREVEPQSRIDIHLGPFNSHMQGRRRSHSDFLIS